MKTRTTKRVVTKYPDNTLKVEVKDTKTLKSLTFAEKLDLMFPTNPVDVTADWVAFDDHKRLK